jgi:hypothetical protein
MRPDRERGQATVELVALLPLVLAVALAAATVLAGQAASEQAGQAAVAGAIALVHGNDARAAARTAIPEEARGRVDITISGSRVTVSFRPRLPLWFLETALEASATADAGKAPNP